MGKNQFDTNHYGYTIKKHFFARLVHCEVHFSAVMIGSRPIVLLVIKQPNN